MVSQIVGLVFGVLMAAESALNLTPVPHQTPLEGGFRADVAFKDGDDVVTYTAPGKWQGSGDPGRAVFRPPDVAQAEVAITKHPKPAVTTFDEETVKALKAELAASLPRYAAKLEWGDYEPVTLYMNRHETYRIMLTYSAFSQRFVTTVLYCNFESEQVRFRLTCKESDFKELFEPFRRSLFSFRGLK